MNKQFAPIRHGILEHIEKGKVRALHEFPVYCILHLLANKKTGCVESVSSLYLSLRFGMGLSYVQKMLISLEEKKYIRRFFHHGTRRPYPILIHKYITIDGYRVDAFNSRFDNPENLDENKIALLGESELSIFSIGELKNMKKPKVKKPPAFYINGKGIPGSVWGRLLRSCGGDRWTAGECLFRARNADNIIAYVNNGLKTKTIFNQRLEEESNGQAKKDWIEKNVFLVAPKPMRTIIKHTGPDGIGDILKRMGI